MKRTALLLSTTLVLAACQSIPFNPIAQQNQVSQGTQALILTANSEAVPVLIQKSPVLAPVKIKPEGTIRLQGSQVKVEIKLPALDRFKTQALDFTGDKATSIIATVIDSHGKSYTPVGADGNGKVSYPVGGVLNLSFANVVPDQLLAVELHIEDDVSANIPQANLAAVISHTGTTDVTASINYQSTPTAKVMKALIASNATRAREINLPALVTKMIEITGVTGGANPTYTTHPTLVDVDKLVTDLTVAGTEPASLIAANYSLIGATIGLTVNGLVGNDKVEVDVTDAASVRATGVGATGSITKATPGNDLKVKVGADATNSTEYTFSINTPIVNLTNNATTPVIITATPAAVNITSLTPTLGTLGSTVTLNGSGFSTIAANNTVKFGSTTVPAADLTVNGDGTQMTAKVPTGVFGSQSITVQVGSRTSTTVNFEVKPEISSLSTAAAAIGTSMTITGTGFSTTANQNTVKFGSTTVPAADVSVNGSGTVLTVAVPAGSSGSQPVTVQVGNQTSATHAGTDFNVIPVLDTLTVSATTPDTTLTLTGSGFSTTPADNSISFGGSIVSPAIVNGTGTSMTVVVPNVFGSMNINVTVAGQSSATHTFESIPKVTGTTGNFVTGSTGDSIILEGKGFHTTFGSNTVKFGTITATVTAATATTVTVTVPEMPADTANATVKVGTQTSVGFGFSVLPKLLTLSTAEVLATKAVLIRSEVLTLNGFNFDPTQANNSVTFTMSDTSTATVTGANLISATPTKIELRVPAGVNVAGDVSVKVTTNSQDSAPQVGIVPTVTLNINNGGFH